MVKSVRSLGMTIRKKSGQEMTILNNISLIRTCPGKLFDKFRVVSPAKRGIEGPRRACPVLTGWAGSFTMLPQTENRPKNFELYFSHPLSEEPFPPFSLSPCGKATSGGFESKLQEYEISIVSNAASPFSVNHVCQKAS
jgi:hypothetical protein